MDPNAYQNVGYQMPGQPVSRRSKIIVISMIVGILLLVIVGFMIISGQKDPNIANLEQIVAKQAEIVRVSDLAFDTDSLSADYSELAANAKLVAASNQNQITTILAEEYSSKVDKKLLASAADQANDDKITQGQQLGDVGGAYVKVLKQLLIETNKLLGQTGGDKDVKTQLENIAASNEEIFKSIPSGD